MRPSFVLDETTPTQGQEPDVQAQVVALYDAGLVEKGSLDSCIFNLVLPAGTVLKLGGSSSLNGLGGYHGSVHIQRGGQQVTLYYSVNVYSDIRPNGRENGIAVFDKPWKNVVGTLYHSAQRVSHGRRRERCNPARQQRLPRLDLAQRAGGWRPAYL